MTDRIEKTIELKAPIDRVWEALTDAKAFSQWFRVKLEQPFVEGELARGNLTVSGYEHVMFEAKVVAIRPKSLFSMTWHPYAIDPTVDYSSEPSTLVEFTLEPIPSGTRLTVVESGFDAVPAHRRDEAFRMNGRGWAAQLENIKSHVER